MKEIGADSPGSSRFAALARLDETLAAWTERREAGCLWLVLAVFAASAIYRAWVTPFWFDELFTLFIARLSNLQEFLRAMPVDNQPPLGDLLTHISIRLLGQSEIAVRLPEILAYLATGLVGYRIVRRHGSASQALFGMTLLLGANVNKIQAITARPYELMLLTTALVFICWQSATGRDHGRLLPLMGVGLSLAAALLSHHFGLIQAGVLLGAGEATRVWVRRRIDWAMLAAIAVGLLPLMFTLRIARQSRMLLGDPILHSAIFWARPSLASLKAYQTMAALPLLCVVLGVALVQWPAMRRMRPRRSEPPEVLPHEWAAAIALSLVLSFQIVLTAFATNYFLPRYAIGTSLGLAVLIAWALPRAERPRGSVPVCLALSTACFVVGFAITLVAAQVKRPIWRPGLEQQTVSPLLMQAPAGQPIVVANGLDYAPQWWYSAAPIQSRMVYLYDLDYARQTRDPLPELSLAEGSFYIPMTVEPYASFLAAHTHFLLLSEGNSRLLWLPGRLAVEGWKLRPIATSGADVLYEVDRGQRD